MLRIRAETQETDARILHLEGKIFRSWIRELQAEIEKGLKDSKKVVLDFAKVSFVDEEAARMIRRFPEHRVEKRNCSLFIRTVLNMPGGGER